MVSAEIFEEYSSPVRWPFQPVVDREYIKQSPDKTWKDGSFNKVPVLTVRGIVSLLLPFKTIWAERAVHKKGFRD
jgi:hypothetical protein